MKIFKVENIAADSILKAYMEEILGYSGRQVKKLFKEKKIKLNGKIGYWDSKVKAGDMISIDLSESIKADILPQNIPLNILYEDEHILAVNKPSNMLVHPTENHKQDTLANGLRYYFDYKDEQIAIRFLNRIDMNTSGIVLIPKSSQCHSALMALMGENKIAKIYHAVVEGTVEPAEGIINMPIGTGGTDGIRRVVVETGQPSITCYKTIRVLKQASYLELRLLTGRTHQIRVHLSHVGNPIIGDTLYGQSSSLIDRQALHAYQIELLHPFTNEKLKLCAELPQDMKALIEKLHE